MKIGFSYGQCIRDIVLGKVKIDDVLFIISGTWIKESSDIPKMVESYFNRADYLMGLDHKLCHSVAVELWDKQKVFQPRAQGIWRMQVPGAFVWADVFPCELADNPAVKTAWEQYAMLAQLAGSAAVSDPDNHSTAKAHWSGNQQVL